LRMFCMKKSKGTAGVPWQGCQNRRIEPAGLSLAAP
jgi:hypothetical protein